MKKENTRERASLILGIIAAVFAFFGIMMLISYFVSVEYQNNSGAFYNQTGPNVLMMVLHEAFSMMGIVFSQIAVYVCTGIAIGCGVSALILGFIKPAKGKKFKAGRILGCIAVVVGISSLAPVIVNSISSKTDYGYGLKRDDDFSTTGHSYMKPKKVEDIDYVKIEFGEDGREGLYITEDGVYYHKYDEDGNYADFHEVETDDGARMIAYAFNNYLRYLDKYSVPYDVDWSLEIGGAGYSCAIYGYGEYPDWFKVLLDYYQY